MKRLLSFFVVLLVTTCLWAQNNVITYTASSQLTETVSADATGLHTNAFGATISSHTFSNGIGIITFSSDVTSIGSNAFNGCFGMTSVTIPNSVTSIGYYAFEGCSSLISVTIPNSVTSIAGSAFRNCSSLTSITIPNSVTSIGSSAFNGCFGMTSVTIPNSVTSIGGFAFRGCSGLTSVTIPNSVTSIGDYAFNYCSGLTSVTIGDGVMSIGSEAFSHCVGLASVTIPNSVTSIGEAAFEYCSGMTSVTIGNGVTNIGSRAFHLCDHLSRVDYTGDIAQWCNISFYSSTSNPLFYAKKLYINNAEITNLLIPNSITSIGNYAFYNIKDLTTVTIPNSVTSIGSHAFSYCSSLTSVNIGNSITSIGDGAFSSCIDLTSITLPNSVTSIGDAAFYGCFGLSSVTLPNSVTSIGANAFYNCSGLSSVTIPNSVTSIGNSAFYNVLNIVYSGTVTGSPWGARYINGYVDGDFVYTNTAKTQLAACSVTATGSITIPRGVTRIQDEAFYYCTKLTSVNIPSSVTNIGLYAFAGCSGLIYMTCEAVTPPTTAGTSFDKVNKTIPVYVPNESVDAYKAAARWKTFTNIQAKDYTRSVTTGNYGTICLPIAVAHEDIQGGVFFNIVYAVTNTNDEVTGILMEEETEGLEAGKPYIFRATADELVLPYTGEAVAEPVSANGLVGNLSETPLDVPQGMYVLSNNQIRKLNGGSATAGQNRAYIDLTNVTKLNYVPAAAPNRVVIDVEGSNPIATIF